MRENNGLVAIYARVSTDEQAQGGTSIETQLEFLRSWAKMNGYPICKEYVDAEQEVRLWGSK